MIKVYEQNILDSTGAQFTLCIKTGKTEYKRLYGGGGGCKAYMWDRFYAYLLAGDAQVSSDTGAKYTFDPTKVYIHYRTSHYLENKDAITVEQAEEILKNINDIEKHLGFTPTKLIRLTNKGILVRPKDEKWISNLYLFSLFLSVIRQQDNPDKHALASFYANPGKLKEKLKEFTGTILENWGKYNGHGGGIYSLYHD